MDYLKKSAAHAAHAPLTLFMDLPHMAGRKILFLVGLVFLVLFIVGSYQTATGGFTRWDAWRELPRDASYQYKPPRSIWGQQVTTPLTNQQLRQLKDSCSCTGHAYRALLSLDVVVVTATALWA